MTDLNRLNVLFDRLVTSVDAIGRTRPIDEILREIEGVAHALAAEKAVLTAATEERVVFESLRPGRRPNEWQPIGEVARRIVGRLSVAKPKTA